MQNDNLLTELTELISHLKVTMVENTIVAPKKSLSKSKVTKGALSTFVLCSLTPTAGNKMAR